MYKHSQRNEDNALKVLHAALECDAKVGGVGSVILGLSSAQAKKGLDVSVVTPGFDVYFTKHFKDKPLEKITTLKHIYKGAIVESDVFRLQKDMRGEKPVYHYLIKPVHNSTVEKIFDIIDDKNIYQNLPWSESRNRLEYFNSAIAAMLRTPNSALPTFDLYHTHTWHTGLSAVLAKELENLEAWRTIYNSEPKSLKKLPHMLATIHMLSLDHGNINDASAIASHLHSVGLPTDFTKKFSAWEKYINPKQFKSLALSLLYVDAVTTVSEGLANDITHGKGQGLDDLFKWLHKHDRIQGITNGIDHSRFDATDPSIYGQYALKNESVAEDKLQIKQILAKKYPQLDPNKMWSVWIARFAREKGMTRLMTVAEEIKAQNGIFIVMGSHVVSKKLPDGQTVPLYKDLIDELRTLPNVLVIDDPEEQKQVGMLIRAASDCSVSTSLDEACGLVDKELYACGAIAVGPRIQGVPDSLRDLDENPENGSGFLYSDHPADISSNIRIALRKAADLYEKMKNNNSFWNRILQYSKQFDWGQNAVRKYIALYTKILQRPLRTVDQIRSTKGPVIIKLFNTKNAKVFNKPNVRFKIFGIGFNKCSTQSLYYYFKNSGISSVHYGVRKRSLASIMHENFKSNLPLLTGIDQFQAYFDMEDIYHSPPLFMAIDHFKLLDKQYPGSKFILHTRDQDKWIKSRLQHVDPMNNKRYADVMREQYNCSEEALINRWKAEWDTHHANVKEYFKDRPQDLLIYNIDTDKPNKLVEFFSILDLKPEEYKHFNKTTR